MACAEVGGAVHAACGGEGFVTGVLNSDGVVMNVMVMTVMVTTVTVITTAVLTMMVIKHMVTVMMVMLKVIVNMMDLMMATIFKDVMGILLK